MPIGYSSKELLNKYPMRRSGGLFLIIIGMTLLFSIVFSGEKLVNDKIFVIGVVVSMLSFATIKYFSPVRPPKYQLIALGVALGLEFILFVILLNTVPFDALERTKWLMGSIVVGIHFLPMTYSFGKILLYLGIACIINAIVGFLLPVLPYEVFGIIDALLKVGVGIILFKASVKREGL